MEQLGCEREWLFLSQPVCVSEPVRAGAATCIPDKQRVILVPAHHGLFGFLDDQNTWHNGAPLGLSHIQLRSANRLTERHHSMFKEAPH
jgi:hypothetical protein